MFSSALALLLCVTVGLAENNGLARLPPMGWRSWNLYGTRINQKLIADAMTGMAARKRMVNGNPTSLCDLGYCDVGLDDGWQVCNKGAPLHFHDSEGNPIVNKNFPDLRNLTDYAHSLGLTAGWYGNNCACHETNTADKKFYEGDVRALRKFGFDSWKLDGCGVQLDLQLYSDLIRADGGKPVMVENCHWGSKVPFEPNATWCPWNFYRSSGDVRASYSSVVGNLNTVTKFSSRNLSYPGCWAYPDMLEVGCKHGAGGGKDPGLNAAETRSHFGAWVIVSSPLTLSHDVNDDSITDALWPVIANTEVLEVSQTYAGFSGGPFKNATTGLQLDEVNYAAAEKGMEEEELTKLGPLVVPAFQYFYKPLDYSGTRIAVLLMNHASSAVDLHLDFADVPGLKCSSCKVRDLWNHKDLGSFTSTYIAKDVAPHDSAFLILTPGSSSASISMYM